MRARLYLQRVTDDGYEADPDARVLSTMKSNYGRTGGEIAMKWDAGRFVAEAQPQGLDRMAANAKAERVFLTLLRAFNEMERHVSPNPSNSYAPSVFAKHPGAEGVSKRAFASVMEAMLRDGRIVIGEHGRGSDKKKHLRVAE
ncbi:MAG: hypothetical protein MUE98_00540 [Rhodobacteraceae bacterium]|nr:hypothetical protein [Paracoccaceae bacterium]